MKRLPLFLLFVLSVCAGVAQHRLKTVQVHGDFSRPIPLVTPLQITAYSPVYALGASVNTGNEWINFVLEYDYVFIPAHPEIGIPLKVSNHELYGGFRYFPMRATFVVGQMVIRPTFGGNYGFDFSPNYKGFLYGGLAFTPIQNMSGLIVQAVYHPGTHTIKGYQHSPYWGIRLSILTGPSAE